MGYHSSHFYIFRFRTNQFLSYRCLAIGRSHAVAGQPSNSLALLNHALSLLRKSLPILSNSQTGISPNKGPLNINVSGESAEFLHGILLGELQRYCALVHITTLKASSQTETSLRTALRSPLSERLGEFPEGDVNLGKIIEHPPTISPIPVKPIFLDVAWNHIDYPRLDSGSVKSKVVSSEPSSTDNPVDQTPSKRGWFGFGR